jgi:hypothetical protein
MNIDNFSYKDFLPHYLTADQKTELAAAMKAFSDRSHLYTNKYHDDILQGDYWEKVPYMDYSGKQDKIRVVILSNSCDIDPSNKRDFPVYMTYAPVMGFSRYSEALASRKMDAKVISEKMDAIRSQKITNMLYLPAGGDVDEDCIVLLDRAISIPYRIFAEEQDKRKITSLNQIGHYLLSFKLSIHFCRIHEGLIRG